MTSKLVISEHIKLLFDGFMGERNNPQFTDQFPDVQVMQPQTHLGSQKGSTILNASLKLNNQTDGMLVCGKSNRFWSANQKSDRDVTQPPSFLG